MLLDVKNVKKTFGRGLNATTALNGISFTVDKGEFVVVVGLSGAGKSTLFNLILGNISPDSGKITVKNRDLIGYLPQVITDEIPNDDITVFEYLLLGRPIQKLKDNITSLYEQIAVEKDDKKLNYLFKKITKNQNKLEYYDEYNAESILLKIIEGMNISEKLLDLKLKNISGGQKSKVAFARLLYSKPEILLLDEPTNHLDIASKEILEEALNNYTGTILYVSHDRYFINSTASRILELVNQTFVNYIGNYDYYLEKKDELTQTYASSQIQRQVSTSQNGSETLPADGAFLSDSKLSWQEQKEQQAKERKRKSELKKTEDEIALLENRNGEIDFQMTLEEVYSNSVKCQELSTERTKNELRLEELYEKWGELAE